MSGQGRIGAGMPSGPTWPNDYGRVVELVGVTQDILRRSGVKAGTRVALNADTRKNWNIVDAFFAAALALEADALLMVSPPRAEMYKEFPVLSMAAMEQAELVVNLLTVSHLYTMSTDRILKSGVPMLGVYGSEDDIIKLRPSDRVIKRVFAVAGALSSADLVRFRSASGTDLTMSKKGRVPHASPGYAHERGNWFAVPSAAVGATAIEESVNGRIVIDRGDKLHKLMHTVVDPIEVQIRDGSVTEVTGGPEADLLRGWFEQWDDENVKIFAHLTIGCDERASLDGPHAEWEHALGCVTFGFGSNFVKALGGKTRAKSHMDFMMADVTCELDGTLVVERGKVRDDQISQEFAETSGATSTQGVTR